MSPTQSTRASSDTVADEMWCSARCLIRPAIIVSHKNSKTRSSGLKLAGCCGRVLGDSGETSEEAIVFTVTVTEEAVDPFKVTKLGVTLQVERAGAPAQEMDTVWLKPPPGKMETV